MMWTRLESCEFAIVFQVNKYVSWRKEVKENGSLRI